MYAFLRLPPLLGVQMRVFYVILAPWHVQMRVFYAILAAPGVRGTWGAQLRVF